MHETYGSESEQWGGDNFEGGQSHTPTEFDVVRGALDDRSDNASEEVAIVANEKRRGAQYLVTLREDSTDGQPITIDSAEPEPQRESGKTKDTVADWTPSCNVEIYDAEIATCAQQIAAGTLPELPNGYTLLFDPVERSDPHFDGYLPAQQYTWHLAMRQVAIALPHTSAHKHDIHHIPGYQRMFGCRLYGDMVQSAAFNALSSPGLSKAFAAAHDGFADQMLFLYGDNGFDLMANLTRARQQLHTLIGLANRSAGYSRNEARQHHQDQFDELSTYFELDKYQQWYDGLPDRIKRLYESMS